MKEQGNDRLFDFIIIVFGIIGGIIAFYRFYLYLVALYSRHPATSKWIMITVIASAVLCLVAWLYNKSLDIAYGKSRPVSDEILVGEIEGTKKPLYISAETRTYHTQVIGSTGSGKTEGITLPWIFDDIEKKRGLLIVDGKPEEGFLKRVYGKALEEGRGDDFLLFSLAKPSASHTFNPLASGTPSEVVERVFTSFSSENEYYRSLAYSAVGSILKLIHQMGCIPKPGLVRELLKNKGLLRAWLAKAKDPELHSELESTLALSPEKFEENFSGITAYFEQFTKSNVTTLLNQDRSEIDFENVLLTKKIVYFQLPTLSNPTLASALGKLVIQSFAATVGKLQSNGSLDPKRLFSVYLDDFNDYIYKEFSAVASKVRSGGVGIVFAHQSLADLKKVSEEFKDAIVENTNNKIVLNINDPESAEFFSRYTGTRTEEKTTERRTRGVIGHKDTGEQSVRDVEAFVIHPNVFKSQLKALEGVAILKSPKDVKRIERIRCQPVTANRIALPPNRSFPSVRFLSEAKMFGDIKDVSQSPQANPQPRQYGQVTKENRGNQNGTRT